MPETEQAKACTRRYARVLGPFLLVMPAAIAANGREMGAYVSAFFGNEALIWVAGAMMLAVGLLIIANHQYWSTPAAASVSLFGWLLVLRGVALLIAPHLYERAIAAIFDSTWLIAGTFGALVLVGLCLTHAGWIERPSYARAT